MSRHFTDINTCARSILVDIADVNDPKLWYTRDGRDKIYTTMSVSLEKYLTSNFFKEKENHEPFIKETNTTDEQKKNILS